MPGASHVDRPVVPHISIPTTYSGAELTPFFGMTDPATRQKQGAGGPTSAPVDRDLRPRPHRLHARPRARRDRHERPGALRGGGLLAAPHPRGRGDRTGRGAARSTRRCPRSWPSRRTPRRGPPMLAGAALAGRCLLNAGMGVHHGLAQLVGGRTGIPHGLANAILLTHAVAFNAEAVPDEVARLGEALGGDAAAGHRRACAPGSACPAACPRWVSTRPTSRRWPGCRSRTATSPATPAPSPRPTPSPSSAPPGSRTPATCGDTRRFPPGRSTSCRGEPGTPQHVVVAVGFRQQVHKLRL